MLLNLTLKCFPPPLNVTPNIFYIFQISRNTIIVKNPFIFYPFIFLQKYTDNLLPTFSTTPPRPYLDPPFRTKPSLILKYPQYFIFIQLKYINRSTPVLPPHPSISFSIPTSFYLCYNSPIINSLFNIKTSSPLASPNPQLDL